jgi:hypothetical protein
MMEERRGTKNQNFKLKHGTETVADLLPVCIGLGRRGSESSVFSFFIYLSFALSLASHVIQLFSLFVPIY